MAKHYTLDIGEQRFASTRRADQIAAEAALDGIYIVRTSLAADQLGAAEVVDAYKRLANVERDFRSLKTIDLQLRPIYHHLDARVRAHVLICMPACYLVWHLRRAWAPLCFTDPQPPERTDPVAPAKRSAAATRKASTHTTAEGVPAYTFRALLGHLATLTRNDVTITNPTLTNPTGVTFQQLATPTPIQRRAFELIQAPIPLTLT